MPVSHQTCYHFHIYMYLELILYIKNSILKSYTQKNFSCDICDFLTYRILFCLHLNTHRMPSWTKLKSFLLSEAKTFSRGKFWGNSTFSKNTGTLLSFILLANEFVAAQLIHHFTVSEWDISWSLSPLLTCYLI